MRSAARDPRGARAGLPWGLQKVGEGFPKGGVWMPHWRREAASSREDREVYPGLSPPPGSSRVQSVGAERGDTEGVSETHGRGARGRAPGPAPPDRTRWAARRGADRGDKGAAPGCARPTAAPARMGRPANRRAAFPPLERGPIGSRARQRCGDAANQLRGPARGRTRAEFQTRRVGAERLLGAAACAGGCRVSAVRGPGARGPFCSDGTCAERGGGAGVPVRMGTQAGGVWGLRAANRGALGDGRGPRMGGPWPAEARRGPVLTLASLPPEAESWEGWVGRWTRSCRGQWPPGTAGSSSLPTPAAATCPHAQPGRPVSPWSLGGGEGMAC